MRMTFCLVFHHLFTFDTCVISYSLFLTGVACQGGRRKKTISCGHVRKVMNRSQKPMLNDFKKCVFYILIIQIVQIEKAQFCVEKKIFMYGQGLTLYYLKIRQTAVSLHFLHY